MRTQNGEAISKGSCLYSRQVPRRPRRKDPTVDSGKWRAVLERREPASYTSHCHKGGVQKQCSSRYITLESFKDLEANQHTVETAKKISTVKIVSYDWLEDSLQSNTRRPKPEGPYLLKNLMKPEKKEVQKNKVTPKSAKVVKETRAKISKRRIGIGFPGLCDITTMQTVLTCSLQLILSSA